MKYAECLLETLTNRGTYTPVIKYDFSRYHALRASVASLLQRRVTALTTLARGAVLLGAVAMHAAICASALPILFALVVSIALNTMVGGIAHNALHRLEPSSMFLDWNGLSTVEWWLEHVSSHHMYTNTARDHDAISMEPFVAWLPSRRGWMGVAGAHAIFLVGEIAVAIQGLFVHRVRWVCDREFPMWLKTAPLLFPLRMVSLMACVGFVRGFSIFLAQSMAASYVFSFLAHLNHATSSCVSASSAHETDDFVTHQLRTTKDMRLGWHLGLDRQTLHHLFPSVDHSLLDRELRDRVEACVGQSVRPKSIRELYADMCLLLKRHK